MFDHLKLYVATLVGFLAIDFVWLAFVARSFYRRHLGFLLADQPNWWAAMAFYPLFVAGLVVFAILPALKAANKPPIASSTLYRGTKPSSFFIFSEETW